MPITDEDWIKARKWAIERMQTYPGDTSYGEQYFQATDELVVYVMTGKFPDAPTFVGLPPDPNIAKIAAEATAAETLSANAGNPPGGTASSS